MSDAIDRLIIAPMTEFYEPPRHAATDPKKLARVMLEYRRVLRGLSETELSTAWEYVQKTHLSWSWPLPAEIRSAAIKARGSPV